MYKEQLISEILLLPAAAIDYHISQHLLKLFPDKAFIESEMPINIEGYAGAGHCTLTRKNFAYNQMSTYWRGPEPEFLHPHHMMMGIDVAIVDGMNQLPTSTKDSEKELFLSSKMRWIANAQQGTMEEVMTEQVNKLREQMGSASMFAVPEQVEEQQGMPPMFGSMMPRGFWYHRGTSS
jgi:hypothetical protein